jgi:hypothetical protein
MEKGYDQIIFWDDDEYPVACLRRGSELRWITTDVVAAHIAIEEPRLDVATGFRTGYGAPFTEQISAQLGGHLGLCLGTALSMGTEFLAPDFLLHPEKSFLLPEGIPDRRELSIVGGGKWVAGGNLSVRVSSIRAGKIPPYYTPACSRGDDTIFSMQLREASVFGVPSGTFHDCFLSFESITLGKYPVAFDDLAGGENSAQRFADALRGWLAYSPLLLRLRDGGSWIVTVNEMKKLLAEFDTRAGSIYPELSRCLEGQSLSNLLGKYASRAESQYIDVHNEAWRRIDHWSSERRCYLTHCRRSDSEIRQMKRDSIS